MLNKKFLSLILSAVIVGSSISFIINVSMNANAQPASWPSSWTLLDEDGGAPGCPDHRDVNRTFYALDSEYLYLRMEMLASAGWSSTQPTGEARYKWWIDTVLGDANIFGTSVEDAEFLLVLKDITNSADDHVRDQMGELTLMDDFSHSGFTTKWNIPHNFPYKYIDNDVGSSLWRRVHGTGTAGTGGVHKTIVTRI